MQTEKYFAAIIQRLGSYEVQTIEYSQKEYLENLRDNDTKIIATSTGDSLQEAARHAVDKHFELCSSFDEKIGLWYHYIPTELLIDDIELYRKLDLRKATDEEILEKLSRIMIFQPVCIYDYIERNFYRGRKYNLNDPLFPNKSDIWHRPAQFTDSEGISRKIGMGRLNKEGESLLYATSNFNSIPAELRLTPMDSFYGIMFSVKPGKCLKLCAIGMNDDDHLNFNNQGFDKSKWTNTAKINYKLVNGFLKTEFTRDVGSRTEFLYRSTVLIAHKYFSPPECHGYVYPSVAHKTGYNIAVKAEYAEEFLEFKALSIYTYDEDEKLGIHYRLEPPYSIAIVNDTIQYLIDPDPMKTLRDRATNSPT